MTEFQEKLRQKMEIFAHEVYKVTKNFPREELYGITSQFRRAALSVLLNYVEGFARRRPAVQLNFLEISYGSLQESKYLVKFSYGEKLLDQAGFDYLLNLAEEMGAMIWTEIQSLEQAHRV